MVDGRWQNCILCQLDLDNGGSKELSMNMIKKKKNMKKPKDNACGLQPGILSL